MKKLSRNDMKNVLGGKIAPSVGGCPAACAGTAASNWQGGTCSATTLPGTGGLPPSSGCQCSVTGGSGC